MNKQTKSNKEQLILEAAEHEFFTKGYEGARTTSIAEKAGVTHAMLHYYYRTKEQLFERVINKNLTLISASTLSVIGNPDIPLLDRIREGVATHFDIVAKNPLLPRFFINEIVARPERYTLIREDLLTNLKEVFAKTQQEIDEAARRGEIEQVDIKLLFINIVSLNIFPFATYPFAEHIMNDFMFDRESYLKRLKEENVEMIMRRIIKH